MLNFRHSRPFICNTTDIMNHSVLYIVIYSGIIVVRDKG